MNLEYGLLMGVLGILITIVGFMIAYIVANNVIEKEKKKKKKINQRFIITKFRKANYDD